MVQARGNVTTAGAVQGGHVPGAQGQPVPGGQRHLLVGPAKLRGLDRRVGPLRRDDGQADGEDDPVHHEQRPEDDERAAQDGPPQRSAALARRPRQPQAHGDQHRAGHERQQAADRGGADALHAPAGHLDRAGDQADHAEEERERGAQPGRQARVQLGAQGEDGRREQHREDVVLAAHAGAHEDEVDEDEVDDDGDDAGDERRALSRAGTAGGRREPAAGCAAPAPSPLPAAVPAAALPAAGLVVLLTRTPPGRSPVSRR